MFLSKISLLNFKNHPEKQLQFTTKLNCFIGNNGVGKTNLLDAIYYLCLTKSYFNNTDQQNILFGQEYLRLTGDFVKRDEMHYLVYKLSGVRKKELTISDAPVNKLSDHIGNYPAIIITPDDSQLILGNSEERRRFIDSTISQVHRQYLLWLMQYNKLLTQRNAALKRMNETGRVDQTLIETYDKQLAPLGTAIYEARKVAIEKLTPLFDSFYKTISLEREHASLQYVTQLNEAPFEELLDNGFNRDLVLQRTDSGVHKDDIDFFIGTNKMKKFGSQGQQKSFIIAIKLAQYHFIKNAKGFQPLLLIDDIFDKLDNDRSQRLVEMISGPDFGQVFITDTDDAHIKDALRGQEDIYEVFRL